MAGLTPQHRLLIDYLADPFDRRNMDEKSIAAGFAEKYVWQLLKRADFLQELHRRTTELVAANRARIYNNLARDSDKGDTQAAVAYLKGCGDIGSGTNVVTNVTQQNEGGGGFADRLKDRFEERTVAAKRDRVIQEDEG